MPRIPQRQVDPLSGKSLVYHTGADGSGTHALKMEGEIDDSGYPTNRQIKAIPIEEDWNHGRIKEIFRSIRPTLLAMAAAGSRGCLPGDAKSRFVRIAGNIAPLLRWISIATFQALGFFGNYNSWDEARSAAGGYDSDAIWTVKEAVLKVKNGDAVYERIPYSLRRSSIRGRCLRAIMGSNKE